MSGNREVFGDVLQENTRMPWLCDTLGFRKSAIPDDLTIGRISIDL